MPPYMPPPHLWRPTPFIELGYTLIVLLACILIYLRARELYQLSGHKGILYFRNTFLYFGLAYLFRFFLEVNRFGQFVNLAPYLDWLVLLTVYLSTVAILYLLYSLVWKQLGNEKLCTVGIHIIAIVLALVGLLTESFWVVILAQAFFFAAAALVSIAMRTRTRRRKGFSQLYYVYLLLFLFWIFYTFALVIPGFLPLLKLIVYAISALLFLIVMTGVLSKTGVHR